MAKLNFWTAFAEKKNGISFLVTDGSVYLTKTILLNTLVGLDSH